MSSIEANITAIRKKAFKLEAAAERLITTDDSFEGSLEIHRIYREVEDLQAEAMRLENEEKRLHRHHVSSIAEVIVNTRDFSGNELDAAKETAADLGIVLTKELYGQAVKEANGEWRSSQKAAGVQRKYWV